MSINDPDPAPAYAYVHRCIVQQRFATDKELDVIKKSPVGSMMYARDILCGSFPEGEDAIATSAMLSYDYASLVLKNRFYKGERTIASDPMLAYNYATNILYTRFFLAEPVLCTHKLYLKKYVDWVLSNMIGPITMSRMSPNKWDNLVSDTMAKIINK